MSLATNKLNLSFNEERHEYTVNGVIVPSVSEIMRPLSEEYYDKIPERVMKKARERGTKIHEAIETYALFGVITESHRKVVEDFIAFLDRYQFKIVLSEFKMTNGQYAGTLDLVLRTPRNTLILVDVKGTRIINTKLLEVQLYAYKNLLDFNDIKVEDCFVYHVIEDGYEFKAVLPNKKKWDELYLAYKN